jgi:hypothetical protein
MTSVLFRDVTTSYPEQTTIQDRTNSGLDIPQGTSDRRRCYRAWATSSSSSRAVDSHQCHGVKRPHLTLEKAPTPLNFQCSLFGGEVNDIGEGVMDRSPPLKRERKLLAMIIVVVVVFAFEKASGD